MNPLIASARVVFLVMLTICWSPWRGYNGWSAVGVAALGVSAENFNVPSSVTLSNLEIDENMEVSEDMSTSSTDSEIEKTVRDKKYLTSPVDVSLSTHIPTSDSKAKFYTGKKEKSSRKEKWGPLRNSKDQGGRAQKLSRFARTSKSSSRAKRATGEAPEQNSKFRNGHKQSSGPDGVLSKNDESNGDLTLHDEVTGSIKPVEIGFTQTSPPGDDEEILVDTSSGSDKSYGSGLGTSSEFDYERVGPRIISEHGVAHENVEDVHHPLGEEYARIHQDILNGIVPQGGFSHDRDQDYPSRGSVAAHPSWLLEDLGPHDLPGSNNAHPINIPPYQGADAGTQHPMSFGHDVDYHQTSGLGLHPFSSDLSHGHGGLGHPFSHSDMSHGMGVGHHNMPSDEIVFDFGLDGQPEDTKECFDKCRCHGFTVSCFWCNLTQVPSGISPATKTLVLIRNNLNHLPADAFHNLTRLETLTFTGNDLKKLPGKIFRDNRFLQKLYLQGNQFRRVPAKAFRDLAYLLELNLDDNRIESVPEGAFQGLYNLQGLWLAKNFLTEVPAEAFRELPGLMSLRLTKNFIKKIRRHDFIHHPKLLDISLAINEIEVIEDGAFEGLGKLKFLDLHMNRLHVMPGAISQLTALVQLNLQSNLLHYIPDGSFVSTQLQFLELENNPIIGIGHSAFVNLPSLQKLELSEAYDIVRFPNLTGTTNLTLLRLDRANVKAIPSNICQQLTKLEQLDLHTNKLRVLPSLTQCRSLRVLNLANNELTSIDGQLFTGLHVLQDLTLSNNFIQTIADDTFVGLPNLEYLNLVHNQIKKVHPDAFRPLKRLKNLNLANNDLSQLPTAGLDSLETLKIFHNQGLREFPPKEQFPSIKSFYLTYAYHCCDYINTVSEVEVEKTVKEYHNYNDDIPPHVWDQHLNISRMIKENMSLDFDHVGGQNGVPFLEQRQELPQLTDLDTDSAFLESSTGEFYHSHPYTLDSSEVAITCLPKPGPFMPCDDLFGFWTLRCGVWVVFMLALLGNGVVFFVSVTSKSKMDVTRFLICNLAAADFFMGVYLGMLAIIDASTLGQFKRYAIQWQLSAGCSIAGFLGVLSSELSVFTLTVITLERFYAITNAIQLNKRLSLKHASMIMLVGWIWSFTLALLPIFGISDYRKFAVCLPFQIEDIISKTYVCFIMAFNGVSFFVILSCYVIMYVSIRHSGAWNSNDTRVAKRMALLVITDLACWAPIAFLSLCAAFGKNLISLTEAKVLTIFVLPLNSCANPFLYAIFTKQFKRDCVLLCRRLEDSSIARHFSQVSPGHLSMSWKCQRRASGLRILVGEGKSGTSNNSASQSCGLVNNNSDVYTSTNKDKDYDVQICKENKYLHLPVPSSNHHHHRHHHLYSNGRHTPNGNISSSNGGTTLTATGNGGSSNKCYNYAHKYKPCPTSPEHEDLVGSGAEECGVNGVIQDGGGGCHHGGEGGGGCLYRAVRYKPAKNTCRGVNDAQVILHQGYCYQNGSETGTATTETYFSNGEFEYDDEMDACKVKDAEQLPRMQLSSAAEAAGGQGCGGGGNTGPGKSHCLAAPKNHKKKSSLKRQKQDKSTQQISSYQRPLEEAPGARGSHLQQQSGGQDCNKHRKRMRPPSITLDSGEAGESIEMIFCPSAEFCELPAPEMSRSVASGGQKVDLDLGLGIRQEDVENDGECIWVKRTSNQPARNQGANGCLDLKEIAGEVSRKDCNERKETCNTYYKDPSDSNLTRDIINNNILSDMPGAYFKQALKFVPGCPTPVIGDKDRNNPNDVYNRLENQHCDTANISVFDAAVDFNDKVQDTSKNSYDLSSNAVRSIEDLCDTNTCKEIDRMILDRKIEEDFSELFPQLHLKNQQPTPLSLSTSNKAQASKKYEREEIEDKETCRHQDVHLKPGKDRKHRSKNKGKQGKAASRHRYGHTLPGKTPKPKAVPIDKSVHLRFFQDSMAATAEARGEPHQLIPRSNSLVELTDSQLQKALIADGEEEEEQCRADASFPLDPDSEVADGGFYGRNPRQSRLRRSLTSKQEESLSSSRGSGRGSVVKEAPEEYHNNWVNTLQSANVENQHVGRVNREDSEVSQICRDVGYADLETKDRNCNVGSVDNRPRLRQHSHGKSGPPATPSFISRGVYIDASNGGIPTHFDSSYKVVNGERKDYAEQSSPRDLEFEDEDDDDEGEESPSSATNGILGWEDPVMTAMNDSDDLRDSLSSARNSADKESGFHSQT